MERSFIRAADAARRFIVTTSRSVLLVDVFAKSIDTLHSGSGLYYGIDLSPERVLVAARNRLSSSELSSALERGEILVFDRHLNHVGKIQADFPLRDMHQIREHNAALYVTCSYDNMIAVFSEGKWRQWVPLGKPSSEPWDVNHFNTIEFIEGTLCVVAHNKGDSEILLFDPQSHALNARVQLGVQAHNVWKSGDEWRVCSSAQGCLVGNAGFHVETGGFPRAVWIGESYSIVGVSELAERKERDFTHGELLIFDSAWNEVDRLVLQNEGLVLDIVAVPVDFPAAGCERRTYE